MAACTPPAGSETTLEGTRWTLQALNGQELQPGTIITMKFDANRLSGRGGCNNYGGEYSLQRDDGFTVGEGGWTAIECLEPSGVMEQETEYLDSLWKVNSYSLDGDTLSLMNEREGILLQYSRVPEFDVDPRDLTGKTWQLISAAPLAGVDLDAFTLQFDGSRYSGTTICRDFEGEYQAVDDSLSFPSMSMASPETCGEEATSIEAMYTTLLSTVWQYNVTETQLELYTDRGEKLVFTLFVEPTTEPTGTPTATPSRVPTAGPTLEPTETPTPRPSYP